jgi:hypothetical protein
MVMRQYKPRDTINGPRRIINNNGAFSTYSLHFMLEKTHSRACGLAL